MNRTTRLIVVAAVSASALLAACGSDNPATSTTTSTTAGKAETTDSSTADFVASGTAICTELGPRLQEAFPDPVGEPDVAFLRSIAGPIADVLADGRDQLAELDPPADQAAGMQDLLDALDDSIAQLRAVLDDDAAAEAMLPDGPPLDAPAEAAAALGFENCGA